MNETVYNIILKIFKKKTVENPYSAISTITVHYTNKNNRADLLCAPMLRLALNVL